MIYHYTSIATLALILQNKTIRFNRLDQVDDPEEFQYSRGSANPANITYISCWTKSSNDNIPQWKMYGDQLHGVRIGVPEQLFNVYTHKGHPYITNPQELGDRDYALMPIIYNPLIDIKYIPDLTVVDNQIFIGNNQIDMKAVGRMKSKDWEFQKECRFIINLLPTENVGKGLTVDFERVFDLKYYDVPMADSAFQRMEIMLGPDVTTAEQEIVRSLMERHLGRSNYKRSVFTGKTAK